MSTPTHPLIRRFVEAMKLQNLRPATIKAYARYAELFQEFLGKTTLASFSREDLRRYLLSLARPPDDHQHDDLPEGGRVDRHSQPARLPL